MPAVAAVFVAIWTALLSLVGVVIVAVFVAALFSGWVLGKPIAIRKKGVIDGHLRYFTYTKKLRGNQDGSA